METISLAAVADFDRCPERYRLRHQLHLRSFASDSDRSFAHLIRLAVIGWARSRMAPAFTAGPACVEAGLAALPADLDPVERARIEGALAAYYEQWCAEALEVVAVEHPIHVAAAGMVTWVIVDVIAQRPNGERVAFLVRGTSEPLGDESELLDAMAVEGIAGLVMSALARTDDKRCIECQVDVIVKPRHELAKATPPEKRTFRKDRQLHAGQREVDETPADYAGRVYEAMRAKPDAYFARRALPNDVRRGAGAFVQIRASLFDLRATLDGAEQDRFAPWSRRAAGCRANHVACEFLPVCAGRATVTDETRYYQIRKPGPPAAVAPTGEAAADSSAAA